MRSTLLVLLMTRCILIIELLIFFILVLFCICCMFIKICYHHYLKRIVSRDLQGLQMF